jgi:alkanesulfonate monooxygenase SsuD/methylene tetrahydromethanopterin reductase-like flavin-dependent oxidoreductase (luciferase family)
VRGGKFGGSDGDRGRFCRYLFGLRKRVRSVARTLSERKGEGCGVGTYDHLWAGLAKISTSVPLSIVGSYAEVVDTIKRLQELGAEYFIFSGLIQDREIERIGNFVLPYVKEEIPNHSMR